MKRKHFTTLLIMAIILGALTFAGREGVRWVRAHPQDFGFAPLALKHPIGSATRGKIIGLNGALDQCEALLRDGGVRFATLPPKGNDKCRATELVRVNKQTAFPLSFRPADLAPSCPVSAALILWQRDVVAPAAATHLNAKVVRIDTFGSYNCRTIAGSGTMSEHATGNAIDVAGFTLDNGRTISVLKDWPGEDADATFLRQVRDGGCKTFATVLSPDYNAAHADHLHMDMAARPVNYSVCR